MDLRERLEALHEQNEQGFEEPVPQTWELSHKELKARYLAFVAQGLLPNQAARKLNRSGTWMRGFRSPRNPRYDPEFAEQFDEIVKPGGIHRDAIVQRTKAALIEAAVSGNVRAAEKILAAYDPDFSFLRPSQFQGDINIERLVQIMPGIPTELLDQMIQALEERKPKALPDIEIEAE